MQLLTQERRYHWWQDRRKNFENIPLPLQTTLPDQPRESSPSKLIHTVEVIAIEAEKAKALSLSPSKRFIHFNKQPRSEEQIFLFKTQLLNQISINQKNKEMKTIITTTGEMKIPHRPPQHHPPRWE